MAAKEIEILMNAPVFQPCRTPRDTALFDNPRPKAVYLCRGSIRDLAWEESSGLADNLSTRRFAYGGFGLILAGAL